MQYLSVEARKIMDIRTALERHITIINEGVEFLDSHREYQLQMREDADTVAALSVRGGDRCLPLRLRRQ